MVELLWPIWSMVVAEHAAVAVVQRVRVGVVWVVRVRGHERHHKIAVGGLGAPDGCVKFDVVGQELHLADSGLPLAFT